MATVTFSAADDVLYAYLAGEIDHDAAQNLRIQLDDALLNRTPRTLVLDFGGDGSAVPGHWAAPCGSSTRPKRCGGCFSWRISPAWAGSQEKRYESRKQYEDPVRLPQCQ